MLSLSRKKQNKLKFQISEISLAWSQDSHGLSEYGVVMVWKPQGRGDISAPLVW